MHPYIHHVPGRLRVKSPVLKGPALHSTHIVERLRCAEGVHSADVNSVTGSLVVLYCPKRVSAESLLESLREHGLTAAAPMHARAPAFLTEIANPLADAFLRKLLDVALQRSAVALIGALI